MSEQMQILKMIEDGEVTPEEGAEMLRNLGSAPQKPETDTTFMNILEQIEKGEISTDDGINWLNAESASSASTSVHMEIDGSDHPETPPRISDDEMSRWKKWWTYPMYVGIGIIILSALWMNSSYQNSGYNFWFFFSWIPLALGILLISLSWLSQKGPWIHVRVRGKDNVSISMPAPLGLAGWALRTFGHHIPNLDKTSVDEIITALDQSVKTDTPLYVNVDDEDGEHVEVFIG